MENMEKTLKDRCLELVSDYINGTKSIKKSAEKELITICTPFIRERYGIAKKYNQSIVEIGSDYDPSSGKIEKVYEIKEPTSSNPKVVFIYYDLYEDNEGEVTEYKAYIDMPVSWIDPDDTVRFERDCRQKKIDYLKIAISYQRSQIDGMEKELIELLGEEKLSNGDVN